MRLLRQALRAYLALLIALAAAPALAEAPRGLMWNRTGLPAVFPLQVRTAPGADWVVVLRDVATGDAALAAGFEGGAFFRVLVPPGTFAATFHSGTGWEGEAALFGEETETFTFDEPLRFGVEGLTRKGGHLIDLRGRAPGVVAMAEAFAFCQVQRSDFVPVEEGPFGEPKDDEEELLSPFDPVPEVRRVFEVYEVPCG